MRMKSIFRHETILFLVVIIALVILSIQAEQFATIDNLLNQGRFLTEVSLVALIMTFVIVTGGIDLSCLLYTSPSPRDRQKSRMPSSA